MVGPTVESLTGRHGWTAVGSLGLMCSSRNIWLQRACMTFNGAQLEAAASIIMMDNKLLSVCHLYGLIGNTLMMSLPSAAMHYICATYICATSHLLNLSLWRFRSSQLSCLNALHCSLVGICQIGTNDFDSVTLDGITASAALCLQCVLLQLLISP
jgi:hypothetical protein